MRNFLVVALALTMFSGIAVADRRGGGRGDRHDNSRKQNARDHRSSPPHRANRPARRANRQVIVRQPVYVADGRFMFSNGTSRTYRRPVHRRYYDANVRPQLIVESYSREPGYIWVRGGWTWAGSEWQWNGGHYAPDPQYSAYYDDGSYDYDSSFSVGASIRIGN